MRAGRSPVHLALAALDHRPRVLDRARHRRAARAADEEALEAREVARHEEALLVVDAHDVVEDLQVHRRREEVLADALDLVRERLGDAPLLDEVVVERPHRIDADDLHAGHLLAQELAGAAERAAGAHAGAEDVELAAGLLPDLRPAREVVSLGVGGVVVLVRVEAVRRLARDALRDLVVAARVVRLDGRGADDDARAEGAQVRDLLLAHLVGHDEDAACSRAAPRAGPATRRCCRSSPRRWCRRA